MEHKYSKRKVSDLIPYANNSRTHSDAQINQVASSIKEFGFTNPILIDNDGGIIAGHGRVLAAKKLKLTDVPCIELQGLTDAQKKAYVIADNQLALNAGWDIDSLKIEVSSLTELDFDVDLLGFDDEFLKLLKDTFEPNFEPATKEEQGQLDELDPIWVDCPNCGKEFNYREHKK